MDILLGTLLLDRKYTTLRERYEEIGGRDARQITVSGLISGPSSVEAIEARLDAILAAASLENEKISLSLRPNRRLWVRRLKYTREVTSFPAAGSFVLELEASNPFEESIALTEIPWEIAADGQALTVSAQGNLFSLPIITLQAQERLVSPAFTDGIRRIGYEGVLQAGQCLVFDGAQNCATLDGVEVTPYTTGLFPHIDPAGTVLQYKVANNLSAAATATVAFRDRWW